MTYLYFLKRTNSPAREAFFLPSGSSDNPLTASADGTIWIYKWNFNGNLIELSMNLIFIQARNIPFVHTKGRNELKCGLMKIVLRTGLSIWFLLGGDEVAMKNNCNEPIQVL